MAKVLPALSGEVVILARKHARGMLKIFTRPDFDIDLFNYYYYDTLNGILDNKIEERVKILKANILDGGK